MIGARGYPRHVAIALAISFSLLLPLISFSQATMPSNWEAKYTNLKNDLRALAIDPLDPQVLFIGSDQQVMLTTDGGTNWQESKSVRDEKITISAAGTEEAQRLIFLIEETGGEETAPTAGPATDTTENAKQEDLISEAEDDLESAAAAQEEITDEISAEQADLEEVKAGLQGAENDLTEAKAARDAWTEDPLSPSDVDSLPYDSPDHMETSAYDQLGEWLSERNLPVPEDAQERQKILIDYLEANAAEGVRLQAEVDKAQEAVNEKESAVRETEEELAARQAEEKTADAKKKQAEKALQTEKKTLSGEEDATTAAETEVLPAAEAISGATYITVDPSNPDNVFLATFNGVYKSTDRGLSWELVYQGLNPTQSAAVYLAVDPSNPDTVFAGSLSGLAVSRDGGSTWDRPAGRVSDKVISSLAVHPFDSQVILAGTEGKGAFKSVDGGKTWENCFTKASAAANSVRALVFAPSEPGVIYAGTEGGIFRSDDGGASWQTVAGLGISTPEVRDVIVSPTDPGTVFIATRRGVFGTDSGGEQWRRLTFGTIYQGCNFLAFDPLNPGVVWLVTDNRLFKSTDRLCGDLSSGEETALVGNCDLTLDGTESHSITIDDIDEAAGTVTITIQSDPQTVDLDVGESKEIDLDGDGEPDLSLKLDKIDQGVPMFSARKIATAEPEESVPELKSPDEITGMEDLEPYFRNEPTWVEVQQAASRWAEVHPDKIASWRRGASLRAFLPEIRFEYTLAREWSSSDETEDEDFNSWELLFEQEQIHLEETRSGDVYKTQYSDGVFTFTDEYSSGYFEDNSVADLQYRGTESESGLSEDSDYGRGRDRDYSLRLEWELGDFLFNNEQLRISREARDLVELRQDVLEQVTLYYFDRRSARIDMILNPPSDPYSRVEMLLRIQQLNASLDTLTGGYFTETIRQNEQAEKLR